MLSFLHKKLEHRLLIIDLYVEQLFNLTATFSFHFLSICFDGHYLSFSGDKDTDIIHNKAKSAVLTYMVSIFRNMPKGPLLQNDIFIDNFLSKLIALLSATTVDNYTYLNSLDQPGCSNNLYTVSLFYTIQLILTIYRKVGFSSTQHTTLFYSSLIPLLAVTYEEKAMIQEEGEEHTYFLTDLFSEQVTS